MTAMLTTLQAWNDAIRDTVLAAMARLRRKDRH